VYIVFQKNDDSIAMLEFIWYDILYRPVFNALIYIYNNWTDANLGWAVVYLTVLLRLMLLPLTIFAERNKFKNEELVQEIKQLDKDFSQDHVLKKEEIRKRVKARKVRPWTKVVSLGIQLLVLVLLYQVFWHGITGEKLLSNIYYWVDFPGSINIVFYGFDLGAKHDILWAGIVAILLLLEIYMDYKRTNPILRKADLFYFILFPVATFFLLWILPMVKSLFILTSMLFSIIIHQILRPFFKSPEKK